MSPNDQSTNGVWNLLEQLHLDSTDSNGKANYAKPSDEEKQATLLAFADTQAITSKRWAAIVVDLRVVSLTR